MANSVDPDEMPRYAASHLGLNCLLRPVCPNTYGKHGNCIVFQVKIPADNMLSIVFVFSESRF